MAMDIVPLLEKATPLITAIFGGIGVKLIDKKRSKRSEDFRESVKIREELRAQLETLKEEIEEWKTEADEWRRKYWEQVEINIDQKSEIETLKNQFARLRQDFDLMKEQNDGRA
jgi:chromosome segregation ATPase